MSNRIEISESAQTIGRRLPLYCEQCGTSRMAEINLTGEACCPICGAHLPICFDVFISFSSKQFELANDVCRRLMVAGLCCWFAPEAIRVGDAFDVAIVEVLRQVKVVVLILSQAAVDSPWVLKEIRRSIGQRLPILPIKVENFTVTEHIGFLLDNRQWIDSAVLPLDACVEETIAKAKLLVRTAADKTRPLTDAANPAKLPEALKRGVDPAASPYAGPRPFGASMTNRFFGRDAEARKVVELIRESRLTLIYAPSGAGKSSLLAAAVGPALAECGYEVIDGFRLGVVSDLPPDSRPIQNIFTFAVTSKLFSPRPADPAATLADALASWARKSNTRGRVLVIDQAEELFSRHTDRYADRVGFLDGIVEALNNDPTLRIVLAMRQEYLADIEYLAGRLPKDLPLRRFPLRRMERDGALAAIVDPARPYADFAPGVAEELLRQLSIVTTERADGSTLEMPSEYIEIVHLQIICERLWKTLIRGATQICMEDLDRAATPTAPNADRVAGKFVANALQAFYQDTINQVANSSQTAQHGGYSKELIQFGCMKFVSGSASRTLVQRGEGRTGRLPDWVVDQLEATHLLRVEQRGGQQWYELSHDLLAEPIGRQINRSVGELLFAADLLDKVLQKVLNDRGHSLVGYFGEHRDVLRECRPFFKQPGLFGDEEELLFRAALRTGDDVSEWSARLAEDHPEIRVRIVGEAIVESESSVRKSATLLLRESGFSELRSTLIDMALNDPAAAVRDAAVDALHQVDDYSLYRSIDLTTKPTPMASAITAIAELRIRADRTPTAHGFEVYWSSLTGIQRRLIRRKARTLRFRRNWTSIPYVVLPAAIFAAATAGPFKCFPAFYGWAMCQDIAGPMAGLFQGITASIVWAGGLALALAIFYVGWPIPRHAAAMLRPLGAVVMGAIAGFLSSSLISLTIASVYNPQSLGRMGWTEALEVPRASPAFLPDIFVHTRCGFIYPITGTALGIGMSLLANALRASTRFQALLESGDQQFKNLKQAKEFAIEVTKILLPWVWVLPLLLTIAVFVTTRVVRLGQYARDHGHPSLAKCVICDCLTQMIGGFFGVVGMGVGFIIMSRGIQLPPRRD